MQTGDIAETDKKLYQWFAAQEDYSYKLKNMERILFEKVGTEYLSEEAVNKLYGKEIITGISRLEKYIECPFAYFLRYGLRVQERSIYQVQSVDIGNLFHVVLERFAAFVEDNNMIWRNLEQSVIDEFVDKCVNEIALSLDGEIFLSTARYRYIIKRISRICKKSIWALSRHIESGSFEVFGTEVEFKPDTPVSGIAVSLNGERKMLLTGRIDRVDILDESGHKYVKIIDYKSGNVKFDLSDIYFGTQLQLIIYIDSFIKNAERFFGKENLRSEILPGGVFYFNIDDPILEYSENLLDENSINAAILESFKMTGLVLKDEDVIYGMDKNLGSTSKIIPVSINKSGIKESLSVAELNEFNELREYVNTKIREIGNDMVSGNINVYPYKKGEFTGCDFCGYKAICKFEAFNGKYNNVKKL